MMILSARVRAFALGISLLPAVASAFILPDHGSRTICGNDKMEDMIKLDAKMQAMGHPIGRITTGEGDEQGFCTGTLIDKDLVLTARHCQNACKDMSITFGFLSRNKETFNCKEIVESGDENKTNQDYMLFRVEGSPGVNWGWYDVSDQPVQKGQELLIIHHPSAKPMKVSRKECKATEVDSRGMLRHRCDTEPGSSGSAIMIPDYNDPENSRIVGVHTLGGCSADPKRYNSGPSMQHLVKLSNTLRTMAK